MLLETRPQVTWFLACFTLDQRRVEAKGDCCCPCLVIHPDFEPADEERTDAGQRLMNKLADCLEKKFVKVSRDCGQITISQSSNK